MAWRIKDSCCENLVQAVQVHKCILTRARVKADKLLSCAWDKSSWVSRQCGIRRLYDIRIMNLFTGKNCGSGHWS